SDPAIGAGGERRAQQPGNKAFSRAGLSGKGAQGRRPAGVSRGHPEAAVEQDRTSCPGEGPTPDRQVMKLSDLFKSVSSFRAQMVAFITVMLALTMLVLQLVNSQLEGRTTRVIDEYIRSIPLATGLVFRSLFEGENLYNLVNQSDQKSLAINSESSIQQILIVDAEGKIFDSTDKKDIGTPYKPDDKGPPIGIGNLRNDLDEIGARPSQILSFSLTTAVEDTETGERKDANRTIYIVISLKRLQQVKRAGERTRLIVFALLGLLLIVAIAIFTKRITRPIMDLGQAAGKVTEG